ncbi:peptide deformylase [Collinsella sp. zg1085]|uniref:peptide deformylase n=1 Tax=Collinsella sp. zg1085 TaxID=2844380 RepID=UPI001C0DEDF3|nr:peptide deformylase [Collinsella sp. zg1085]QWT17897.1 peptide deformylase [Collinsella sp. zg1085]
MIRELIRDEALLSMPCEPATAEDAELAADLIETLASLEDAGCLAANQLGVPHALFAYEDEKGAYRVMLNPKLVFGLGPNRVVEACLTREGESTAVRHIKIKVDFDALVDGELVHRRREFAGFTAQMIQHMIDHCNGKYI